MDSGQSRKPWTSHASLLPSPPALCDLCKCLVTNLTQPGPQGVVATVPALDRLKSDFPGGAVVKNPPANAGDMGSSPGPGRSHMPQSN